ncbi:hypothetical protein [Candidatus Hepatobacter penaei]|uniref:hypothetical protein n=1 Tax=Candidatus Hepatobacter penaei TaxID=1274402 RepID=UPI0004F33902|nr:hypothetical protein [Candidatus Hepatobacter penaei]
MSFYGVFVSVCVCWALAHPLFAPPTAQRNLAAAFDRVAVPKRTSDQEAFTPSARLAPASKPKRKKEEPTPTDTPSNAIQTLIAEKLAHEPSHSVWNDMIKGQQVGRCIIKGKKPVIIARDFAEMHAMRTWTEWTQKISQCHLCDLSANPHLTDPAQKNNVLDLFLAMASTRQRHNLCMIKVAPPVLTLLAEDIVDSFDEGGHLHSASLYDFLVHDKGIDVFADPPPTPDADAVGDCVRAYLAHIGRHKSHTTFFNIIASFSVDQQRCALDFKNSRKERVEKAMDHFLTGFSEENLKDYEHDPRKAVFLDFTNTWHIDKGKRLAFLTWLHTNTHAHSISLIKTNLRTFVETKMAYPGQPSAMSMLKDKGISILIEDSPPNRYEGIRRIEEIVEKCMKNEKKTTNAPPKSVPGDQN